MQTLETKRLRLIPFSLDLIRATINEKIGLSEMLTVQIPASWPGSDIAEALPFFAQNIERDPSAALWGGLIIHKTEHMLIGDMGFMGGPDSDGVVEIGYSIVPEYRNQGYATEMLICLIDWALQIQGIRVVTAKTHPDNPASIKVLTKAGMRLVGPDHDMFLWEFRVR